jgi:hypothetical protein
MCIYNTDAVVQYFCNNATWSEVADHYNLSNKEDAVILILSLAQREWDKVGCEPEGQNAEQLQASEAIEAEALADILSLQ